MGNQASNAVKKADETREIVEESSGEGGQKIRAVVDTPVPQAVSEDSSLDLDETDSETDSDSDLESDDEEDEGEFTNIHPCNTSNVLLVVFLTSNIYLFLELMERLRILEDARQLKQLAVAFLHPELPVEVDSTATARCYFDRASAPEQETLEEADYRQMVLADAAALKQAAIDYMYPELGVVTTDPSATARCYFDRASAPEQESLEEAEERRMVLADAAALKKLAIDYMHPELGVVTTDPSATARCYFDRASAPEQESLEEAEERRMVLADAAALKKLAIDYMHPELGVVTTDPSATARCYFDRASAPEQESVEEAEERRMVLADAAALKKLAIDYMHPELGVVTTDPSATARCYFDRASAPEQESVEYSEERRFVLVDAAALKKLAVDYKKTKFVQTPVVKHVGTKTLATQMEGGIKKSASRVELYGLDHEHGDDFY